MPAQQNDAFSEAPSDSLCDVQNAIVSRFSADRRPDAGLEAPSDALGDVQKAIESQFSTDTRLLEQLLRCSSESSQTAEDASRPHAAAVPELLGLQNDLNKLGEALERRLLATLLKIEAAAEKLLASQQWATEDAQRPGQLGTSPRRQVAFSTRRHASNGPLPRRVVDRTCTATTNASQHSRLGMSGKDSFRALQEGNDEAAVQEHLEAHFPSCFSAAAHQGNSAVKVVSCDLVSRAGTRTVRDTLISASRSEGLVALHAWLRRQSVAADISHPPVWRSSQSVQTMRRWQGFVMASSLLIVLNVVFIVVDVQMSLGAAKESRDPPAALWWVALAFAVLFLAELAVRLWLQGWRMFRGRALRWNLFDGSVLVMQVVDLATSLSGSLGYLRAFRTLRVAPVMRLVHTVRHVKELRFMVVTLSCSLASLFWAQVFVIFTLLCVALGVQQLVTMHVTERGIANVHPDLPEHYGSLLRTVLTLFHAISGGDWQELVEPLEDPFPWIRVAFAFYVACVLYGLLNILIAVFVECSSDVRNTSCLAGVKEGLEGIDPDHTGIITMEKFQDLLEERNFQELLSLLGLDIEEALGVFKVLDLDAVGSVAIEAILNALTRLTGNPRSVDIASTLYENQRVLSAVTSAVEVMSAGFRDLKATLRTEGVSHSPSSASPWHSQIESPRT